MKEELKKLIKEIRLSLAKNYDEATIKQTVVLRILYSLNWNIFSLDEVIPEFSVENRRIDYCLRIGLKNKIFIEVKKNSEDLKKHQQQLLDYSFKEGIEIAILTNGNDWWFYLPMKNLKWIERIFLQINILTQDDESIINSFINFLLKDNVINNSFINMAELVIQRKNMVKSQQEAMSKIWNKLMIDKDSDFLEFIRQKAFDLFYIKLDDSEICDFIEKNIKSSEQSTKTLSHTLNQTQLAVEISNNLDFEIIVPKAYIPWGGIPATQLKDVIPMDSTKKNPFTINFLGQVEVKCYIYKDKSRIKMERGTSVLNRFQIKENSKIVIKVIRKFEYLQVISIKND